MENKVSFWQKNQVLIASIAGALTLVLQQAITQPVIDYKALALAAITAVAGIIGNEWRGKGASLLGIIGVVGYAVFTVGSTGTLNWQQIIISVVLGGLALVAPPPKSIGYEYADQIKAAKKEGEVDVPTALSPKPDPAPVVAIQDALSTSEVKKPEVDEVVKPTPPPDRHVREGEVPEEWIKLKKENEALKLKIAKKPKTTKNAGTSKK